MPKLDVKTAKKSKLSSKMSEKNIQSDISILDSAKEKIAPTSVRFSLHERQEIVNIKKNLNRLTRRKVSESDVIRALVFLGSKASIEELYEAYKANM